jgi:hypothetical protein
LSAAGADYLLVGAHALAAHGVVRATGREDLLRNKRATGRLRDLADAEELEKLAT